MFNVKVSKDYDDSHIEVNDCGKDICMWMYHSKTIHTLELYEITMVLRDDVYKNNCSLKIETEGNLIKIYDSGKLMFCRIKSFEQNEYYNDGLTDEKDANEMILILNVEKEQIVDEDN